MPLRKRYRDALVWHVHEAAVTLNTALLLDACDFASENLSHEARAAIDEHVSELVALEPSTAADAGTTTDHGDMQWLLTGGDEWALKYEFPDDDERAVGRAYYKYSDRDLRVVGNSKGWLAIYERIR